MTTAEPRPSQLDAVPANSGLDLGGVIAVIGLIPAAWPVVLPAGVIIVALGGVVLWVDMTFCDYHGVAINWPVIGPVNIGC
jgi:hypothetical protein